MRIRHLLGICLMIVASRPASVSAETEYFAVFMEGKKVGHAIQSRVVAGPKVTTTEEVSITISRAGIPVTMNMTETSVETTDGEPVGFESIQNFGIVTMKVAGTVSKQGTAEVTVASMGAEQKSTIEWPDGALMAEGLRLLTLKKGLKEGVNYTAKVFSPGMLQALDARVSVGAKQNIDLLGRVISLTEVKTTLGITGAGEIVSTSYVDEDLRAQKTVMPVAGMQIEMIACAKEFALSQDDVLDLVDKLFLPSPVRLENVASAKSITYYLSPRGDANGLKIPSTDNQSVRTRRDGGAIVTVRPLEAPKGATFPYEGKDREILQALQPNRFLQSDSKEVIKLARRAVGRTKDAAKAVKRIEAFVAEYIENKNLSVGYATATEVVASRQGDCSEHAVLTAAMCRAVGIPAQVVVGVAYVDEWTGLVNGFGGHAWTRAYVGGKWFAVDAAFKGTGRGGYGPGHITLAVGNGEPADFFNIVTTLGQFKIDKIIVDEGK